MSRGFVEGFLRLVQTLANIFELILEVIERFLRLGQFLPALLESASDFVPLMDERDRLQGHQQSIWRNRKHVLLIEPVGEIAIAHGFHI